VSSDRTEDNAGLAVVVTGPSGVGKSSILRRVVEQLDAVFSTSATTRPARPGEQDGQDYFFLDRRTFQDKVQSGQMLEWAEVYGEYYGTPAEPVRRAVEDGKIVVMDVDFQGAAQLHEKLPQALLLLIVPPDEAELQRRLRGRKTETEEKLQDRLGKARREMAQARESGIFDAEIVNDRLERAVAETIDTIQERRDA
jgi:guanylate kinase